jgi:hypothetical protein
MLSAPVFDSWEGPNRQCAIGDAIFGKKFFPRTLIPSPFSLLEKGARKLFFGNRLDTAPRWSTVSLEAKACGIQAVSARIRR